MNITTKLVRQIAGASHASHAKSLHQNVGELQDLARRYAREKLRPIASRLDEQNVFPSKQIAELGQMGMLALGVSPKHGGAGVDTLALSQIVETLSAACASTGAIVSIHNCLFANLLEKLATDEQKEQFLRPCAEGELGCFALTEPEAGSDAASLTMTASEKNGAFFLNGLKSWVTNASVAKSAVIFATIDSSLKHKGITAFIVPLNSSGIVLGALEDKLGIRAVPCCNLALNNVKVDKKNVLGDICDGFRIAMMQLDQARIGIASQALGIAQAALDEAIFYSIQRMAFNKPLIDFQAVKLRIADMSLQLEAARLLVHRAAAVYDSGERCTKETSMGKAAASMAANMITHNAIQIFGANGYVKSSPVQRHFRDARVTEIYGGVTDIQKFIIADSIFEQYLAKQRSD